MEPIRAAVVKDGVVTNVIMVESVDDPAVMAMVDGILVASDAANIGDSYDAETGEFTPPPPDKETKPA